MKASVQIQGETVLTDVVVTLGANTSGSAPLVHRQGSFEIADSVPEEQWSQFKDEYRKGCSLLLSSGEQLRVVVLRFDSPQLPSTVHFITSPS